MATEVMSASVALNGVNDGSDQPGKLSHMANGVLENGLNGHHDQDGGSGDEAAKAPAAADLADPAAASDKSVLGPPPESSIGTFGEATAAQPAAIEKVVTRHDFYLIRVPRPDLTAENSRIKTVQMIIAEKKEKQNFINAAVRIKQTARSEALTALRGARDRVRSCSAEVRKKFDEAKPLQDMLRKLNEGRKDARAQGRSLEATSEAELNDLIAQKEHRMLHDSISLTEEKQLMKEIKLLEASRPKVREMEALYVHVNEALGQKDAIQAQLKPLLAEAELLKEERDAAHQILSTFEAEFQVCEDAVKELMDERGGMVSEQDVLYDELRALRAEVYKKEDEFRQYRRDLAAVQEMAQQKDVAGVRKFCEEQRERVHAKLNKDAAYRKRYVAANQWSTIRRFGTPDTRRLGVDEDPATLLDAASAAGAGEGKGPSGVGAGSAASRGAKEGSRGGGAAKSEAPVAAAPAAVPAKKAEDAAAKAKAEGAKKAKEVARKEAPAVQKQSPEEEAAEKERVEAEKEKRRQEAMVKAKEAEERKRKLAERAQQRAEAKAAKDAEEAAKRREKEKERKARKKAAEKAEKDAAAAAAAIEAAARAAESPEGEEDDEEGAAGEGGSKGGSAGDQLTKRQRKRMAAGKGKGEGADEEAKAAKSKGKKGKGAMTGGGGPGVLAYVAAALGVLVLVALLLFWGQLFPAAKPVSSE